MEKRYHKFNIMMGAVFTDDYREYPEKLYNINAKNYPGKITEVYGSLRLHYLKLPSARPDFRIPDKDVNYLEKYVKELAKYDIDFNYAMNANHIGNLEDISKNYDVIVNNVRWLESIGVKRVIVSHALLMDIISTNTNMSIEVSTILNVNSLGAISELKSRYPNFNKICMSIDFNRNIDFVKMMQQECKSNNVELEILVSEFCVAGMTDCSQIMRQSCYDLHSQNMTENVARNGINSDNTKQQSIVRGYPWSSGKNSCIFSRSNGTESWLQSKTIWPAEIEQYCEITGINKIKVTGRTGTADWSLWLAETYASGKYEGPLSGLWLALPASVLSNHANFEKYQKAGENTATYKCKDLSTKFEMLTKIPFKNKIVSMKMNFMDLFFMNPDVDWRNVKWVDKPMEELKSYESNWIHEWHKLLKMSD